MIENHRVENSGTILVGLIALLSVTLGCGSGTTANVAGNVTLDGEPLTTGTVTFQPLGAGRPAYGAIDSSGSYSVKSTNETGLPAGSYRVTVVALETPQEAIAGGMPRPGASLIPARYADLQQSGLSWQVVEGDQQFDIALTSNSSAN